MSSYYHNGVAIIGALADTGDSLTIDIGLLYLFAGRRATLLVSFFGLAGGFLCAYYAVQATAPSYALMCLLFFLIGHGSIALEMVRASVSVFVFFSSARRARRVPC